MSLPVEPKLVDERLAKTRPAALKPIDPALAEKTARMIAAIWERNRPLVEERLRVLEGLSAAAGDGTLSEGLRREGHEVSHKLSGSLGMFGFPEGTAIARELEKVLGAPELDTAAVARLVGRLRVVLDGPAEAVDLLA